MLEHPDIVRVEKTGYANLVEQPEHFGTDYFGDEVLLGDEYIEHDGEIILKENLDRYLTEVMEFEFKQA
ncbi:YqaI family protein [Bacillus sp. 03113]|uniref:YqaI family protein n=1 Tax=Bacillus sp. 03113 TaxID=2578211 RepID=UPI0011429D0E|nr:hypothetical protein [Bacillus sp. 03113]